MAAPEAIRLTDLHPDLQAKLDWMVQLGPGLQLSVGRHKGCDAQLRLGVDVRITSARDVFRVTSLALEHGITRVGYYPGLVHLDVQADLPQQVIWIGKRRKEEV